MQIDFFGMLTSVFGLFMLIAVGYFVAKCKVLPAGATGPFSRFLLTVALPCSIFNSLQRAYDPAFIKDILWVLVLGVVFMIGLLVLGRIAAKVLRIDRSHRGVWAYAAAYSNFGFMGFPIILTFFGETGLALAGVFSLPANILFYSWGLSTVLQDVPEDRKNAEKEPLWKKIVTPVNVAAVLGILFYFLRIIVPNAIATPLTHLGNVTTPLSMVVTGMNLASGNPAAIFKNRDALLATAGRLVVSPLVVFAVCQLLLALIPGFNPFIVGIFVVLFAMPSASVVTILAELYGADKTFAAQIVFLTSLLSILTIPFMTLLL